MLVDRVFGNVSNGAGGCGVDGMPSPTRTSEPAAPFGKTGTSWEKPGVEPSTALMVAPIMRSKNTPIPPRTAVLPLPDTSHAKPRRGAKLLKSLLYHWPPFTTVRLALWLSVLRFLA